MLKYNTALDTAKSTEYYVRKHVWTSKKLVIVDVGPFENKREAYNYVSKEKQPNTNYTIIDEGMKIGD